MMAATLEHLSAQFKIYLLILHTVVIGLIVHILVNMFHIRKYNDFTTKPSSHVRIVHVDDKKVTVDSCQWINSILKWIYTNSSNTPDLVKIWLAMLNEKLKVEKSSFNYRINGIVPGSLPPKFTNVYCSDDNGSTQCVALHIESTKLGFFISLFDNNNPSEKLSNVKVNITKLSGQLMFQVLNSLTHYDLTIKFIGDPELEVSSEDITEDSERSAVEEKLKDVICKTVINVPLTDGNPSEQNIDSASIPETSSSCVDLEGKLLVKVVKASELSGEKETEHLDAYCVITCKEPPQKKKTASIKGSKEPLWKESFVLDINGKTKELAFDIYNELKTPQGKNFHMNDILGKSSDTDADFLGQVIVPLTMISKDQTCRLILPILPISTNSSFVTGQISLEFSYDKDGKRFQSLESQSSLPENTTGTKVTKIKNPRDGEEKSKEPPQMLVFSMATIDIVEDENDELHFEPLADHGVNRHDIIMAEQCVSEGLPPLKHGVDVQYETLIEENRKHEEMLQELKELDRRNTDIDDVSMGRKPKEVEHVETKDRPSSRESRHSSKAITPDKTNVKTPVETLQHEQKSDVNEGGVVMSNFELDETRLDEASPETRRQVFRAAFSERINRDSQVIPDNVDSTDTNLQKTPDRPRENVSPQTKSGSDLSLSSVYEGSKSILVVETKDRGEIRHFQIPTLMAKRGTFDQKGTKLHIFNDHIFVATHFTGGLPSCSICKTPLTGYFGKQGYECRDCHMITHKRCHTETSIVCQNSTVSSMKIVLLEEPSE